MTIAVVLPGASSLSVHAARRSLARPSVFELQKLSLARVVAAALALLLATTVEVLLQARHPPAAATTLLVALGSFKPTWRDTTSVLIGVFVVALVGDVIRRYRVRQTPTDRE